MSRPGAARRIAGGAARAALSVALLVLLLGSIDREPLLAALARISPMLFAAGAAAAFCSVLVLSFRLRLMLVAVGRPVRLGPVIAVNLVGAFFALILPTSLGGDLARVYELHHRHGAGARGLSTVLIDRTVGLLSMLAMGLVALLMDRSLVPRGSLLMGLALVGLVALAGGLVLLGRGTFDGAPGMIRRFGLARVAGILERVQASVGVLSRRRDLLGATLLLSLVSQTLLVISAFFLARSLGTGVSLHHLFIAMPVVWLVTTLPITLGGLGLREGALVVLLGGAGVASGEAVALGLLIYACRLLVGLVGGLVFLAGAPRFGPLSGPAPEA